MASADENSRRRRVTYRQLEALWEILNSHKELAVGYNKTSQAREYSKRMWESVAENLNSEGEGAVKTWKGWSSYWVDYKAKLKKKMAAIRLSNNRTGGGPPDAPPLSDLEKKFIQILGEDFGLGLPNISVPLFPTLPPTSTEDQPTVCQDESEAGISPMSPVPPLVTLPQPQIASRSTSPQSNNIRRVRNRRRRSDHVTQDVTRRALVESAEERLELARRNTETWEQMLPVLNRIAVALERQTIPSHLQILQWVAFEEEAESNSQGVFPYSQ